MTTQSATANPGSRRGPRKVRLGTEMIVAAGLEVAAESRSSVFSPKELGVRLGVNPSAIYRHFRNKRHLMEAMLDELQARALSRVTAHPDDWRGRIRQLSESTLTEYCMHPAIAAEATVLTTHGRGELDSVELLIDGLTKCGLSETDIVKYYALLSSYILSTASGIARARSELGDSKTNEGTGGGPWLEGPILVDPREYPRIAHFTVDLAELEDREIFLLGVETLLDSAERAAATQPPSNE